MNLLSEADFNKLRSTGLLYVVEPDCDGSYESYLKVYGKEAAVAITKPFYDKDGYSTGPVASVGVLSYPTYKPVSFSEENLKAVQNAINNPSDIALRPKHIVRKERMLEILGAMQRYAEDARKIPLEWVQELEDLNDEVSE